MHKSVFLGFLVGVSMASAASAAVLSDFESPPYTAGASIDSLGGWKVIAGTAVATPSASFPQVLVGQQSMATSGSTVWVTNDFPTTTPLADGATFSYRTEVYGNVGSADMYLSSSTAGYKTNIGVSVPAGGNFTLLGGSVPVPGATVPVVAGREYQVEMVLNYTAGNLDAYVTDLDGAGPRTFLGTVTWYSPISAADMTDGDGGLFLITNLKDNAGDTGLAHGVFDQLTVTPVPEPASAMILGGVLIMGLRRTRVVM